jgi:UDP-2,4-diacetamido-2,4,6-trideoxy-beta-L-altropyranose hydrolase
MNVPDIAIRVDSGHGVGTGHLTRCIAIAQALRERGAMPRFHLSDDDTGLRLVAGAGFAATTGPDDRPPACDILVVDSYRLPWQYFVEASECVRVLVSMDDEMRMSYPSGLVVNSTLYAPDLDYPPTEGVRYLLGPQYHALRQAFWDVVPTPVRGDVTDVLVMLGGTRDSDTLALASALARVRPDLRVHGVALARSAAVAPGVASLSFGLDDEQMVRLLGSVDACVTAGGQTLFELARSGVPAVSFAVAENQVRNLAAWGATGSVVALDEYSVDEGVYRVARCVDALDPPARAAMSAVGPSLVDGQGARRVAAAVIERWQ